MLPVPADRGQGGSLQFPGQPSDRSAPLTPEDSSVSAPGSQIPSMAFAHNPEARLPLGPRFRAAFVTTLQVSLHATDRPFARPPRMRTLSFRFDARISPHAGNQLPGTLASPRTGLTPAGCPELVARLHHELLSLWRPNCWTHDLCKTNFEEVECSDGVKGGCVGA